MAPALFFIPSGGVAFAPSSGGKYCLSAVERALQ